MPSSVPDVLDGLADYLASWEGLRPADDVVVASAPVAPEELAEQQVTLGDVTAPQAGTADLSGRKPETPTLTCWIARTVPGTDEAARRTARREAYELLAFVSQALKADPTAGGTVPGPGGFSVGESSLEQVPAEIDGSALRRANLRFTVTWTSHIV